jgi:hypothetical protein
MVIVSRVVSSKRRRILLSVVTAVVAVSSWFAHSRVAQGRREAAYQVAMAPFKRDLPVGIGRRDVERYLHSRDILYNGVQFGGSDGWTYEIEVGEEPDGLGLVCEPWKAYVALEFSLADALKEIHIRKSGTCL